MSLRAEPSHLGDLARAMHRAPIRILVPAVTQIVVVAVLVRGAGADALGLWITLYTVVSLAGLAETALAPQIQKELWLERSANVGALDLPAIGRLARGGKTLITGTLTLLVATIAIAVITMAPMAPMDMGVRPTELVLVMSLLLGAAGLAISSTIVDANLSGCGYAADAQASRGYGALVLASVTIPAAFAPRPLVALALATVVGNFVSLMLLRRRATSRLAVSYQIHTTGPLWDLRAARDFAVRSRLFNLLAIANQTREPLFRIATLAAAGPQVAGLFDVSSRLVRGVRDLALAGITSASGYLTGTGSGESVAEPAVVRRMIYVSQATLLTGGGLLGGLIAVADPILALWVPSEATAASGAFRIMVLWGLLTLPNAPFWVRLQVAGLEGAAFVAIGGHTVLATIGIVAIRAQLSLSDPQSGVAMVAMVWLLTSIPTQLLIFWALRHDGSSRDCLRSREWSTAILLAFLAAAWPIAWTSRGSSLVLTLVAGALPGAILGYGLRAVRGPIHREPSAITASDPR